MSDKLAANTCNLPLFQETGYKATQTNNSPMKKYNASFEVIRDEEGNLCAADKKQMIFTDGKTIEELMENIRDAVECYFEVPSDDVDIIVEYK